MGQRKTTLKKPKVRADIRVWKVVNGEKQLCTDSGMLKIMEESAGFSEHKFWHMFPQPLADGYYYAVHTHRRGNYFAGTFDALINRLNLLYPVVHQ